MRKRLSKKVRQKFTEHGFGVQYTLADGLSQTVIDDFLDCFVEQAIEAQNLSCGGGGRNITWNFFVTKRRGSPTDAQRNAVGTWMAVQPEVVSYNLGEFVNAQHDTDEAMVANPSVQVPYAPTTQAPGSYMKTENHVKSGKPLPLQKLGRAKIKAIEVDLIDSGCEQIRPGVWVSKTIKIFTGANRTALAEFTDLEFLQKLLNEDVCDVLNRGKAPKCGALVRMGDLYAEIFPRRPRLIIPKTVEGRILKLMLSDSATEIEKAVALMRKGYDSKVLSKLTRRFNMNMRLAKLRCFARDRAAGKLTDEDVGYEIRKWVMR